MTINCKTINVKKGSKGADVTEVQKYLTYFKYYSGNVDGICGSVTVEAIKKFQKDNGLKQDGVFGTLSCQKSSITGKDISSTMRELSLSVWKDIMNRFNNYVKTNGKEPEKSYINKEYPYEYILNAKYKDIKQRYDDFVKKNGREPNVVNINKSTTVTSSTTTTPKTVTATTTTTTAKKTLYVSEPYYESQGKGLLGQGTPYWCGPHSIHQCLKKLGITKYSEATIAGYAGTTSSGTGHSGLNTAIAKIAKLEGITLKVEWKYFSDLGNTTKDRFETIGKLLLDKNKAIFFHSQYRYGESNGGKGFGHYEVNKTVNLSNSSTVVLNSLGTKSGNGYLGYKETRNMSKWQTYINHTCGGQPSICIITKV